MRNFIVCASFVLLGMSSALPCMAANSEKSENVVNVENQAVRAVFLGYLNAINVEESGAMLVITVPAPRETMLGTAPASEWFVTSGQLVIRVKKDIVEGGTMEVAVRLSNGDTGIYYVTWN